MMRSVPSEHDDRPVACFDEGLSMILQDLQHALLELHERVVESKNPKEPGSYRDALDQLVPVSPTNLQTSPEPSECESMFGGPDLAAQSRLQPRQPQLLNPSGAEAFNSILPSSKQKEERSLTAESKNLLDPERSDSRKKMQRAVSFDQGINAIVHEQNTGMESDDTEVTDFKGADSGDGTQWGFWNTCSNLFPKITAKSSSRTTLSNLPLKRQGTGVSNSASHPQDRTVLELLPVWSCPHRQNSERQRHSEFTLRASKSIDLELDNLLGAPDDVLCCEKLNDIIIQPLSAKRICWDLLTLLCITWDLVTIPLQLFRPPPSNTSRTIQWITIIFWTLDVPLSFITGTLMPDGDIQMHPRRVMCQYVRGWFVLDIVIVSSDWITVFLNDVDGVVGIPRLLRYFRLVRLFRIMRIAKIPERMTLVGERIWSEHILVVSGVMKIIALVLGVAHILACLWYGVSRIDTPNWVIESGYESEDWSELYLRCFHWSMAQFVGELLIAPVNVAERAFAIMVVLLTFIVAAGVVSSITSSMTRLAFLTGKRGTQLATLRKYLLSNGVSQKLMLRIQRNAQHALLQKQLKMTEAQVELISLISEPLRLELHFEEHGPKLCHHPFFQFYQDICPAAMQKLCHSAIIEKVFYHGDIIFSIGELPSNPQMYFISSGSLLYQQSRSRHDVSAGMWLSEGVLWVRWVHRGVLRAKTESQVLALSATSFQDITCGFESPVFHPSQYGTEYVEHIKSLAEKDPLSDLGTREEADELLEAVFAKHEAEQNAAMTAQNSGGSNSGSSGWIGGGRHRQKGASLRFSLPFGKPPSPVASRGMHSLSGRRSHGLSLRRTMTPQEHEGSWLSSGAANLLSKLTGRHVPDSTSRTSVIALRHSPSDLDEIE